MFVLLRGLIMVGVELVWQSIGLTFSTIASLVSLKMLYRQIKIRGWDGIDVIVIVVILLALLRLASDIGLLTLLIRTSFIQNGKSSLRTDINS